MRLLTENEICERALRKIGATAIRSAGARPQEIAEAKYWFDMVMGHIAARERTWWLVPQTAVVTLTPGVWSYDMNAILGPQQATNGIQAVIDVWLGSSGIAGPDAYPHAPGWLPLSDDTEVHPIVERNGMVRLGHVRRQEWEGIQVVDLPPPGPDVITSDYPADWLWLPAAPPIAPAAAPPWWNPALAWPPAIATSGGATSGGWPPTPWPFAPTPPAPVLSQTPPPWWNPAYFWPPNPYPPYPASTNTQFGAPRFVYIDRGDKPTINFSPCPDWNGPYTVRVLYQTYSPDFVSAQGNTIQAMLRETWNLCIVTQLAYRLGNGPIRKLPADEVREMKAEAAQLLTDLENYDNDEQAGLGRVSFFNGV